MTELRKCPYCGHEPHLYTRGAYERFMIRCDRPSEDSCYWNDMEVYANSEEKAICKWNRKVEKIERKRKKDHLKNQKYIERFEWKIKW